MNIGIFIYPDAEVLDFSGPFEVFSTASRLCGDERPFRVFLIAETAGPVTARGGYRVLADYGFGDHPPLDVLIVSGGVHTGEMTNEPTLAWLKRQADSVRLVATVCTGIFILAQASESVSGNVTTHWEDVPDLQARFDRLTVLHDLPWVDQGALVTSGGISAGIDMSLHLVSRLHSDQLAVRTARQMEFRWRREGIETGSGPVAS